MTIIIDGKAAAASVIEAVTSAATWLQTSGHRKPGLAVVIVGDDPASHAHVGAKSRWPSSAASTPSSTRFPRIHRRTI